jgi:UV DNA damage endonuclease
LFHIGQIVKDNKIRISMHPDQSVILNSPNNEVVEKGIRETNYQSALLNAMKLDNTANDDYRFCLNDRLKIHDKTNVPVLLDIFHHECKNDDLSVRDAISSADHRWEKNIDGVLMIDYSNQEPNFRKGKHANTLDVIKFKNSLSSTIDYSYDLMLEIKDKEKSATKARQILTNYQIWFQIRVLAKGIFL